MSADPYSALTPHLHAGERLLWFGRPKQGLLLRAEDAWLIPFALIWCFFAFPGALSRVISGGFFLFDLLFLVVGLYREKARTAAMVQ